MSQPEQPYKSPRKVEEELRAYRLERFESYMQMADRGELTRALAITAFQEELEAVHLIDPETKNAA